MHKLVSILTTSRGTKKFFDLPLDLQIKKILKLAIIISILLGIGALYFVFGLRRMFAFVLLALVCVPVGMLFSKIKESTKKALLTSEEDDTFEIGEK